METKSCWTAFLGLLVLPLLGHAAAITDDDSTQARGAPLEDYAGKIPVFVIDLPKGGPKLGIEQQMGMGMFLMMSLKGSSIPTDLLSSAKPKPTNVDLNAVDPQAARGYVGSRVCLGCHESLTPETVDAWKTSPMANTFSRIKDESEKLSCLKCHATGLNPTTGHYSEESVGCEGCHGPGREAVEFVLKGRVDEHKKRLHLDVNSKLVCISCHDPHEPLEGHPARHRRQSQTGSK